MMDIQWQCRKYKELSVDALYELLELRVDVFVVEQNCPYRELDGKDQQALHLMGRNNKGKLIAYSRILPANTLYAEATFGRLVVEESGRGEGAGEALLDKTRETIMQHWGEVPVRISAQTYLVGFYQNKGFKPAGKEYLEDGIPHIEMLYTPAHE